MSESGRSLAVDRYYLRAAAIVEHGAARGAEALTELVRRASGIAEPSPPAVAAAVVRGATALAPTAVGGALGVAVDVAGAGAVLAIATLVVALEAEADGQGRPLLLDEAIARAEREGLCSARAAAIWRAGVALHRSERAALEREAARLVEMAVEAVSLASLGKMLGRKALSRAILRRKLPRALRASLRGLSLAWTLGDAWRAMGEAARLVEATRALAEEARGASA